MADRTTVDSLADLSPRALGELRAWFESWHRQHPTDATVNQGVSYGVRSVNLTSGNVTDGYVLTATGDGGSEWAPELSTPSCPSFSDGVLELGATSNLLGYWRLGDGPTTFADSNTFLSACDASKVAGGAALTNGVTGALDPSDDDGAVQFNGGPNFTAGDYLSTSSIGSCGTRFDLSNTDFSCAFWMNPTVDSTASDEGVLGSLFGGAVSLGGWGFHYSRPAGTVSFIRAADGGSVQTTDVSGVGQGAWAFVVGTYSTVNGMKLYVDGVLVDSDSGTSVHTGTPHIGVWFGAQGGGLGTIRYFKGILDEVSIYGAELTPTQIGDLFSRGGTCTSVGAGSDVAGETLVSNGDGTSDWAFPEFASYVNGT